MYRPLLFDAAQVPAGDAEAMEAALDDTVAAVIVEPLVQGAAGILVHPEGWLRTVREMTRARGIPLIVDEVATAFGRTGTMFACEHEGVEPDLMCVAKGLTGGYLPLAATLTTEAIYDGFLGAFAELRTFFHATPTRATPWPAPPRWPRSTSSRSSARSRPSSPRSPCSPTCWPSTSSRSARCARSAGAA